MNKKINLLKKKREWNLSKNLSIDIMETGEIGSEILQFGINWGALGTVTPEKATEFSNKLNECVALVKGMNEFVLSEDNKSVERKTKYKQGDKCNNCKKFIGTSVLCPDCNNFRDKNDAKSEGEKE